MSSLAQRYEALQIVGVDIDSALVDQCKATVENAFSLQRPLALPLDSSTPDGHSSPKASVEQEPSRKKRRLNDGTGVIQDGLAADYQTSPITDNVDYFPAFFPSLFGTIDVRAAKLQDQASDTAKRPAIQPDLFEQSKKRRAQPASTNDTPDENPSTDSKVPVAFPRNLVFYAADWPKTKIESDTDGYDVVLGCGRGSLSLGTIYDTHDLCLCSLSLTKWIHLHDRDEGLIRFFQKCYGMLHPGGVLILEKQGWKGYKQAKRMSEVCQAFDVTRTHYS